MMGGPHWNHCAAETPIHVAWHRRRAHTQQQTPESRSLPAPSSSSPPTTLLTPASPGFRRPNWATTVRPQHISGRQANPRRFILCTRRRFLRLSVRTWVKTTLARDRPTSWELPPNASTDGDAGPPGWATASVSQLSTVLRFFSSKSPHSMTTTDHTPLDTRTRPPGVHGGIGASIRRDWVGADVGGRAQFQAALMENSSLASAQAHATRGWLPHHTTEYTGGNPAGGFYEAPNPGPPISYDHASVRDILLGADAPDPSIGHGHALFAGDDHTWWAAPPPPGPPIVMVSLRDHDASSVDAATHHSSPPSAAGTTTFSSTVAPSSTGHGASGIFPPALTTAGVARLVAEDIAAATPAAVPAKVQVPQASGSCCLMAPLPSGHPTTGA
jgi:hypothetical protein